MKDRILVYPCGSEIGLEIYRAFKGLVTVELFGASAVADHGQMVYENYIAKVPRISATDFFEVFNAIIQKHSIGFIMATHEDVGLFLAENTDKLNATLISPPAKTCKALRSKAQTYKLLQGKVALPKQYQKDEVSASHLPLFLKPDALQGGQGTCLAKTMEQLHAALKDNPELLVLEYLPGQEVTVDCYTNAKGQLRYAGARLRNRVFNGISVNTTPINDPALQEAAEAINKEFDLTGAWFFQMKQDALGQYKLLEVAPRIASSMALYRNLGINFPQLAYYAAKGIDCELLELKHDITLDRALLNRFKINLEYNEIYFDFDDCLYLADGTLDLQAMSLVIKARNEGKKVTMLTKHEGNLTALLDKLGIAPLFSQIVHIAPDKKKSDFITNNFAIFIDNSFKERHDVFTLKKIPVFAPDAIESLI